MIEPLIFVVAIDRILFRIVVPLMRPLTAKNVGKQVFPLFGQNRISFQQTLAGGTLGVAGQCWVTLWNERHQFLAAHLGAHFGAHLAAHFGAHFRGPHLAEASIRLAHLAPVLARQRAMPALGWHFPSGDCISAAATGNASVAAVRAAREAILREVFMCISLSEGSANAARGFLTH